MRSDLRQDLGDGWYLITDLPLPPDDPRANTLHLEGPGGTLVYVPFEAYEEAFHALGIRRKRRVFRARPGPAPAPWRREILPTIRRLSDELGRGPLQREVTDALVERWPKMDDRALARAHQGIRWRTLVRFALWRHTTIAGPYDQAASADLRNRRT